MWADAKKVGFKDIGTPELDLLIFTQPKGTGWTGVGSEKKASYNYH